MPKTAVNPSVSSRTTVSRTRPVTVPVVADAHSQDDPQYDDFLERMQTRFESLAGKGPLFTTDVEGDLFATFLKYIKPKWRQHYTCTECRHFVNRFGNLVTIADNGRITSVLWDEEDAIPVLEDAVTGLVQEVHAARVNGVFLCSHKVWGTPRTGVWRHMAIKPPKALIRTAQVLNDGQDMATKREDYGMLQRALDRYPKPLVETAVGILKTDALYRSEKCLGVAEWLLKLHQAREAVHGKGARENVVWLAVATAPAGFCHVNSSMIGTMLDDLAEELPFEDVSKRFAAKMHPLQYLRPQAAPSAGAIKQAEAVIEKLAASGSLRRRYARLDEIAKFWTPPTPVASPPGGVFAHLTPKGSRPQGERPLLPSQAVTWAVFARDVLPNARSIEILVPSHGYFEAWVTAADLSAPPIIQWDNEEVRNPFSWDLYNGGSFARDWRLGGGTWYPAPAIAFRPSMWTTEGAKPTHHGAGVTFFIEGARDMRHLQCGLALFPEILKAEFHGIRSVIEAHSRSGQIEGLEASDACGLTLTKGDKAQINLRVDTGSHIAQYCLDRWE